MNTTYLEEIKKRRKKKEKKQGSAVARATPGSLAPWGWRWQGWAWPPAS
jgi:hypothetical protein